MSKMGKIRQILALTAAKHSEDAIANTKVLERTWAFVDLPSNDRANGQLAKFSSSAWICGADNNTDSVGSVFGRVGAVTAQSGDYGANQITNSASSSIASTMIQATIQELGVAKC